MASGFELLNELDGLLRPQNLAGQIRVHVCSDDLDLLTLDDKIGYGEEDKWEESMSRAKDRAFELGEAAAADLHVIDEFSQELFVDFSGQQFEFGRGLACRCSDLRGLWDRLVTHMKRADVAARNCRMLIGIIDVVREQDCALAEDILDGAVQNPMLRRFIVPLQSQVSLNRRAVERLLRSLEFEDTPSRPFADLAHHRPLEDLDETGLAVLLENVLARPNGASVVIDELSLRIRFPKKRNGLALTKRLKALGIRAVTAWFDEICRHSNHSADHSASNVLKACMDDTRFPTEIEDLFDAFFSCLKSGRGSAIRLAKTVTTLAEKTPVRFLDGAFASDTSNVSLRFVLFSPGASRENPLSRIHTPRLLEWCRQGEFQTRLVMLAKSIDPFAEEPDTGDQIFSGHAKAIIDATANLAVVLSSFAQSIFSNGLTNNQDDIVTRRRRLFEVLLRNGGPGTRTAAEAAIHSIDIRRRWEAEAMVGPDREQDHRFEKPGQTRGQTDIHIRITVRNPFPSPVCAPAAAIPGPSTPIRDLHGPCQIPSRAWPLALFRRLAWLPLSSPGLSGASSRYL